MGSNSARPTMGRDYFEEIVDLLIPVLQKRGLFRKEYEGRILREHLQQY